MRQRKMEGGKRGLGLTLAWSATYLSTIEYQSEADTFDRLK